MRFQPISKLSATNQCWAQECRKRVPDGRCSNWKTLYWDFFCKRVTGCFRCCDESRTITYVICISVFNSKVQNLSISESRHLTVEIYASAILAFTHPYKRDLDLRHRHHDLGRVNLDF